MADATLWKAIRTLAGLMAIAYVAAALIGGFAIDFDSSGGRALWFILLLIGAALLGAGLLLGIPSRWSRVLVLVAGGVLGALVVFWAILPILAALALAVLGFLWARRPSPSF
jgi:hypothetical protein